MTLSRSDVNGLVLEIPLVDYDGNKIYNDPTLMGLASGKQYPCSLGNTFNDIYCYYEKGSNTRYGIPTRIYMTSFSVPSNKLLEVRLLITNPDITDVIPRFVFKAFGGSVTAPKIMGDELMGTFEVARTFKVYPESLHHSNGTCSVRPNAGLWRSDGWYRFYVSDNNQTTGGWYIGKFQLTDGTYGQIGDYGIVSNTDTHFMFQESEDKMWVIIVR